MHHQHQRSPEGVGICRSNVVCLRISQLNLLKFIKTHSLSFVANPWLKVLLFVPLEKPSVGFLSLYLPLAQWCHCIGLQLLSIATYSWPLQKLNLRPVQCRMPLVVELFCRSSWLDLRQRIVAPFDPFFRVLRWGALESSVKCMTKNMWNILNHFVNCCNSWSWSLRSKMSLLNSIYNIYIYLYILPLRRWRFSRMKRWALPWAHGTRRPSRQWRIGSSRWWRVRGATGWTVRNVACLLSSLTGEFPQEPNIIPIYI